MNMYINNKNNKYKRHYR